MALAAAAKRVADEFEFTGDQVRNGVKEFLKEMGTFNPVTRPISLVSSGLLACELALL
jgi:hypothetical protein